MHVEKVTVKIEDAIWGSKGIQIEILSSLPRDRILLNNNKAKCTKHFANHSLLFTQFCRAPSATCPSLNRLNRVLAGPARKIS